jgi:plasmid maintenance system antidote protein VapI
MSEDIDLELQRQIDLWQRDEAENEAAQVEAAQVEARELDEFLKRLLNAPSDL